MKHILLLITLFVLMGLKPIACQPTELDTTYRKVYLSATGGACSYLASPIVGLFLDIEITDDTYPLVINWESGIMTSASRAAYTANLSFGKRFKKFDFGIAPFGFMAYTKRDDFMPTMSVYTTLRTTNRFYFNVKALYYFSYNNAGSLGINATLNFRIKQFKKL